jgi:hypothetical protein
MSIDVFPQLNSTIEFSRLGGSTEIALQRGLLYLLQMNFRVFPLAELYNGQTTNR